MMGTYFICIRVILERSVCYPYYSHHEGEIVSEAVGEEKIQKDKRRICSPLWKKSVPKSIAAVTAISERFLTLTSIFKVTQW
jgi:hypothetical protein